MGTTVLYHGGKMNVSLSKGAYRVFKKENDRVDKAIFWKHFPTKKAAWAAACAYIDGSDA